MDTDIRKGFDYGTDFVDDWCDFVLVDRFRFFISRVLNMGIGLIKEIADLLEKEVKGRSKNRKVRGFEIELLLDLTE